MPADFTLPFSLFAPVNFFIAYAQERAVETVSLSLRERARQILYVGAGLSFLAILSALITRVVLTFFCAMGAGFCFWLASWAFQERERELAEAWQRGNERLAGELEIERNSLKFQVSCNQDLRVENENYKKKNEALAESNTYLETRNGELLEKADRFEKKNDRLKKNCEELAAQLERIKRQVQRFSDHASWFTSEKPLS